MGGAVSDIKMLEKKIHFGDFGNLAKFVQRWPLFVYKMAVLWHASETLNFDFFVKFLGTIAPPR